MTQLDIILVLVSVTWVGIILLAYNKGSDDYTTAETITGVLLFLTAAGFAYIYFF